MSGDRVTVTWHYRPGDHWAVVGPTASALLIGDASLGLAQRIWALLSDPADAAERVLDAMAHDGVAGLPSFVLVEHTVDAVRALVRGTAVAHVRCEDDGNARAVSGVGFRSWREEAVSGVVDVLLANSGGTGPAGPQLPVRGGIVRAAELHLQLRDGAAPPAGPPAPAGTRPVSDPSLTLDQSAYDPDGDAPAAPPVTAAPEEQEPLPPPLPEPAPAPPEDAADAVRRPGDDYLELLAGMTRVGTVEDAAVRVPQGGAAGTSASRTASPVAGPPGGTSPADAPATPPSPPDRAPSAAPVPAASSDPQPRPAPGLISSVPFSSARPAASGSPARTRAPERRPQDRKAPAPPPSVEGSGGEDAELTIVRLPQGAADGTGGGVPSSRSGGLPAVVCSRSHANPPESERCRVCGEDLSGAERQWVERPAIGRLRFDGPPGLIPVTGPMVIGRAPRVDRVSGDAVPTMVTVPGADGDISRSHLRIAVEGWHVMVIDLNATNGTVVQEPNGESRRLHPGEEKMIVPGSRVTMADIVGFVFEAQE